MGRIRITMKNKKRILYLNYTSILTQGILLSQVVIPLKKLAREGYPITLVSGERAEDLKKRREREALHGELEEAGVDLVFFRKCLPPYLRVEAKNRGSSFVRGLCFIWDQIRFFLLTGWLLLSRKCRILHARSYVPALVGSFYKIFGVKLIFDPRGILPEELRLARGWGEKDIRYRVWKMIEKFLLERADVVFALSRPFREHLKKIAPRDDILITPCCIDPDRYYYDPEKRSEMRSNLHVKDHFVLVYSVGCFVPYQVLEEALEVFKILKEERKDAHFLILSPDAEKMKKYAADYGLDLEAVSIVRAPFSRVPEYLMASDAGLLARHTSIISEVASPVKFPEYLACGLPVLAFRGIGDTEAIIQRYNVGECVDFSDKKDVRNGVRRLLSLVKGYDEGLRKQCRDVALKFYSWESYLPLYRAAWRRGKVRVEK